MLRRSEACAELRREFSDRFKMIDEQMYASALVDVCQRIFRDGYGRAPASRIFRHAGSLYPGSDNQASDSAGTSAPGVRARVLQDALARVLRDAPSRMLQPLRTSAPGH